MKAGGARTRSISGDVANRWGIFGIGIHVIDETAIAFFDRAAAEFHAMGQHAVLRRELVGEQDGSFELLEASQIPVNVLNNTVVELFYEGIVNKFGAGRVRDFIVAGPSLKHGEVRGDEHSRKLSLVPDHDSLRDQSVVLKRVFDRLRRNELAAGGFEEVFFAVRDREIAVAVEISDVAGLEPAIGKRFFSFGSLLPIP